MKFEKGQGEITAKTLPKKEFKLNQFQPDHEISFQIENLSMKEEYERLKKYEKKIMESKEIEEITAKMNTMDEILKKNIFNNPVKEANEKIRKELLEFKEIFKKNLSDLSKQVEGGKIKSNINVGNSEEINDLRIALEHKTYQVEILKKEFTKYEEKAEEQIENLKNENAKLKYRIHILLNTIDELENKTKK